MNEPWTMCSQCHTRNLDWGKCVSCGEPIKREENMNPQPTPETNAEESLHRECSFQFRNFEMTKLARELERERDYYKEFYTNTRAQFDKVLAERDSLREKAEALDWLEQHLLSGKDFRMLFTNHPTETLDKTSDKGALILEAINAARQGEK